MVTKQTNAYQRLKAPYIINIVASSIFRPLLWPFSGRCIAKSI